MGVVLNQPTEVALRDAVGEVSGLEVTVGCLLHRGGPCEGPLMVLHSDASRAEVTVLAGVYFATDPALVEGLLCWEGGPAKYFAGYSGWGPGQLEREMESEAWLVTSASVERVFSSDEQEWVRLVRCVSSEQLRERLPGSIVPRDPSSN